MAPKIPISNFRMISRCTGLRNFARHGLRLTPAATFILNTRYFADCSEDDEGDGNKKKTGNSSAQNTLVEFRYVNGIPHLTIPLPSRDEKCVFALKPISHKVGDLIDMLKKEDHGIDRATIINSSGVRVASTCSIESLLDEDFSICINDKKYNVEPPKREQVDIERLDKVSEIKQVVAQLYEVLNVSEYQTMKSNEMQQRLDELKFQLRPLERKKAELTMKAAKRTNIMSWVGLGLMSVQFGILARLTWWEYSWDIMEPVTYFVTYGTTMAMYAYYCVTKEEYVMENVKNREFVLNIYKNAKKEKFNIDAYNRLKREEATIIYNLSRLRDPLNTQLAPKVVRSQSNPPLINLEGNDDKPNGDHKDKNTSSSLGGRLKSFWEKKPEKPKTK